MLKTSSLTQDNGAYCFLTAKQRIIFIRLIGTTNAVALMTPKCIYSLPVQSE